MKLSPEILNLISRLESAGFEAYVVGGSLRDSLLGKTADDVDMTTSALPEETAALFSDLRVIPTGIKHGTVTVLTPSGAAVEITTFRTDGAYSDSRHPDSVTFTRSLDEDLARRDFTVNAMAYSPKRGIIDIFGGRRDLESRTVRCVGDPERRFDEDALRILRAFRFSAQLGFDIEENTLRAALDRGESLSRIARERVRTELMKLLSAPCPSRTLAMMQPILRHVLPLTPLPAERLALCDSLPQDPLVRLAALIFGTGSANELSHSLRLSNADRLRLCRLSESTPDLIPRSDADARRLLSAFSDAPADCTLWLTVTAAVLGEDLSSPIERVRAQFDRWGCLTLSSLRVSGSDLVALGIADGKMVGVLLRRLLDTIIIDPSLNERDTLIGLSVELQK